MATDIIYRQGRVLSSVPDDECAPQTWISLGEATRAVVEQAKRLMEENEAKRALRKERGAE